MLCIMVGSVLAAFLVPLAVRAWLASPRPVEAPVRAAVWESMVIQISQNVYAESMNLYPALAVLGPNVCVAWSRQVGEHELGYYDPYYRSSSGNGGIGTWGGQTLIHSTSPITTETMSVDVAIDDGGELHFVWSERTETPYSYTLYYSSTLGVMETITQTNDPLAAPAIAVHSDKVHVVWSRNLESIEYTSKTIGGASWGSIINIRSAEMAIQPDIAVDDGGIAHVVWSEGALDSSADVFYKNTSNWSAIEVSGDAGNGGRSPAIAVHSNDVYVVWSEFVNKGVQYIRFRQAVNGGSWNTSRRISEAPRAANQDSPNWLRPDIAVDSNGKIHVAFNGAGAVSDPEDIYYAYKKPGEDWRCCENVTKSGDANDTTPAIATGGPYVHLIWAGPPFPLDPDDNEYEVRYTRADIEAEMDKEDMYLPIIMKSAS